jgi:hypothetical protein
MYVVDSLSGFRRPGSVVVASRRVVVVCDGVCPLLFCRRDGDSNVLDMLKHMWKPSNRRVYNKAVITRTYVTDAVRAYMSVATQSIEFLLTHQRRRGACV